MRRLPYIPHTVIVRPATASSRRKIFASALIRAAIEDHQVPLLRRTAVHVAGRLLQTLTDGPFQTIVQDLALDHEPACGMWRRPGSLR